MKVALFNMILTITECHEYFKKIRGIRVIRLIRDEMFYRMLISQ